MISETSGYSLPFKKYFRALLFISAFVFVPLRLMSQTSVFTLDHKADTTIIINKQFNNNTEIQPFNSEFSTVYGLTFSGKIKLNSDTSLVRIILVDDQYKEYLVYESYSLLEEKSEYAVNGKGEETVKLSGVKPLMLKLEITDASLDINKIEISTKSLKTATSSQQQIYRMQTIKKNRCDQPEYSKERIDMAGW